MKNTERTNTQARVSALAARDSLVSEPTGLVEYRSVGRLVVIGGAESLEFLRQLKDPLRPQLLLLDGDIGAAPDVVRVAGREIRISGHMGDFHIQLGEEGRPGAESLHADLVLDLSPEPLLTMPLKPVGYLTARAEADSLAMAREQLETLCGVFEKPRFFSYDASRCAHSRSGQPGCNRCVETCPAEAITGLLESIEVDPYLCQGGGICAAVCPSGAIRYAYPGPADTLDRLRAMLAAYLVAGGTEPVIAFVARAEAEQLPDDVPDNVLPFEVEELASVGLDIWLSALAFGARSVILVKSSALPHAVRKALDEQLAVAGALLGGLGYPVNTVRIVQPKAVVQECAASMPAIDPAKYAGLDEKRRVTYMAMDHLAAHASDFNQVCSLPEYASFGQVIVDPEACTLCMSCTSVCPMNALKTGGDTPRLQFCEMNCVQCGICAAACPEQAIQLEPRMLFDRDARRANRTLYEEPPFCCVSCGKPFATQRMVDNMMQRLDGHWMFQDERARRRLMMCEDCRVVDVVQDKSAMEAGMMPEPNRH